MRYGIELVPYSETGELVELARRAEGAGFDTLWVSDLYHNRHVHSVLTRLAAETEGLKLGPGVTNPYLFHPGVIASAVATLNELSGGRAVLGISAGEREALRRLGVEHEKPVTTVREAIVIVKRLLNGDKVDYSGEVFECDGAELSFSHPGKVPIYVGGRGEQMTEMAGEFADGALFNASTAEDVEECIKNVEKGARRSGRNLDEFDSVAYMATSVGEDREEARDRARSITSFIAASAPESTIVREGLSREKIGEIRGLLEEGDKKRAREEVSEKMLDVFSVSGTWDELGDRIEKVNKTRVDSIVVASPLGPEPGEVIERIGEIIDLKN